MDDTAVPMYNFINSLLKINLAMLAKFAIRYGSGKVGSSHCYLDRRPLHEIDEIVYEYDRK